MSADPISCLFAGRVLATAKDTAAALGIDVKTLRTITEAGLIRAVRVGKVPRYIEADVRSYLTESPAWVSTSPRKAASGITTSPYRGNGFMARRAKKPSGRPSPTSVVVDLKQPRAG